MASLKSHSFPEQVSLGTSVRDTGTINVIFPPTRMGITLESTGSKYRWDVYNVVVAQGGDQSLLGELDITRRMGIREFLFQDWDELRVGGKTRDDSLRIVGQLNPDSGWSINGIGRGKAEWRLVEEGGGLVDTFPLTLTGGPPRLDDVRVGDINPVEVSNWTVGGKFVVLNPLTIPVNAKIHIDYKTSTGAEIGTADMEVIASGSTRLNVDNENEFDIPPMKVPERTDDIDVCPVVTEATEA